MTTLTQDVPEAIGAVRAAGTPERALNPIYRALTADEANGVRTEAVKSSLEGPELDLLVRQMTAPAVMVLAVEAGGLAHRVRVGVHADGATVEHSEVPTDEEPGASRWSECVLEDLPRLFADVLPDGSALGTPPRLTVQNKPDTLRLDAAQLAHLRELLVAGADAETAFSRLDGLDPRLQDALTARGDRASLSLTLHSPDPARLAQPVSIARLWNCGQLGIYRTDTPDRSQIEVVAVEPGDVLGTVIPLLEESIRFASGLPPMPGDEDPAGTSGEGARS